MIWSVAIIGQRLGQNEAAYPLLNAAEDFGAFLLPAATAHLAISVALEGRRSRWAGAFVISAYAIGFGAWLQAALDPAHPILPAAPHWEPLGLPGEVVGWAFIVVRAAIFAAGIGWLVVALRRAGQDHARQRQIQVMLATLALGISGGMARILPQGMGGPAWVGVSLVAAAAVLAVYTVLAQRLFAGVEMTARAFRASLLIGLGVTAYVVLLVAADRWLAAAVGMDLPVVIALAVVVTIVLFDPIANVARQLVRGGSADDLAYAGTLRAMGGGVVSPSRHDELVEPAMARLVRMFDLTGSALIDRGGRPTLVQGELGPDIGTQTRVRLESEDAHVTFGPKRSGLPLTPSEIELLRLATSYLDAAIRLRDQQGEQASAMAALSRQGDAVQERGAVLTEALAEREPPRGLHVYALGPLRAERDGEPIRKWGGAKAGSRQAEAIFAFLFDRGERGATKDEIVEVVWPDVDLERADVAFHRTLLGLRSVLTPGRTRRGNDDPISFGNDRYRLAPGVVAWSDAEEFERLLTHARAGLTSDERLRNLEAARALYRAELLDDCPFYGDSVYVEERRDELRERYVDLLVDLAGIYAERGDRSGAADALRRARAAGGREIPAIPESLGGLAGPATG